MDKGILLINKPVNITSFDIIRRLRKITKLKKIGHAGTLDPFATGLMIVCLGKYTKVIDYFTNLHKTYQATLEFGRKTATGDPEGEFIETVETGIFSEEELKAAVEKILQVKSQVPSAYSAIKINGKAAYKYARNNQEVEIKARSVEIRQFRILSYNHPYLQYSAQVSKGTYIRTLSETFAELLNTVAYTTELTRLAIDDVELSRAVDLENLNESNWQEHLISPLTLLSKYPIHVLTSEQIEDFQHGRKFNVSMEDSVSTLFLNSLSEIIGFGNVENQLVSPKMVFV